MHRIYIPRLQIQDILKKTFKYLKNLSDLYGVAHDVGKIFGAGGNCHLPFQRTLEHILERAEEYIS